MVDESIDPRVGIHRVRNAGKQKSSSELSNEEAVSETTNGSFTPAANLNITQEFTHAIRSENATEVVFASGFSPLVNARRVAIYVG